MAMIDVPQSKLVFDDNVQIDDTWMNYLFDHECFLCCTAMPSGVWRLYMSPSQDHQVPSRTRARVFQDVIDQLGLGFHIGEPTWSSAWKVQNNIADRSRNGRVLICGDASHVHSPASGQGMNGAMQDAFNLAWKLAAVWKGHSDATILDTYEVERKLIGEQISRGAAATHEIIMGFGTSMHEQWQIAHVPNWETETIALVSALSHSYVGRMVLPLHTSLPGPKAGERVPYLLLRRSPTTYLHDLIRRSTFTIIILGPATQAAHTRDLVVADSGAHIWVWWIGSDSSELFDFDHQCRDEGGHLRATFGFTDDEGRVIVVRPDMVVGLNCGLDNAAVVLQYLRYWYRPVAVHGP